MRTIYKGLEIVNDSNENFFCILPDRPYEQHPIIYVKDHYEVKYNTSLGTITGRGPTATRAVRDLANQRQEITEKGPSAIKENILDKEATRRDERQVGS